MILYVSKLISQNNIAAKMHYEAIKEIFGEENVFTIDLSPAECYRRKNYIAYGKYKNIPVRIIRWFQGNMQFISLGIINQVIEIIKKYKIKIVFIEDSVFGNLVKEIKQKYENVKVFSFYHDVKADLYRQWMVREPIYNKIELSIGIHQEYVNHKYSDVDIVFNQRDAKLFRKIYKQNPDEIIPLPAPIPFISEEIKKTVTAENEVKKLLFVGKKYYPNIVGMDWFFANVLPKLNKNIKVEIVGMGLECLKGHCADSRVEIIGGVDSLTPYYENADIVIAPLFDGGGMKCKTAEAISFGKVIVATDESLFGFWEEMDESIQNKICYKCNSAKMWIHTLNMLAEGSIHKYNERLYGLFLEKFSYDVVREKLRAVMKA